MYLILALYAYPDSGAYTNGVWGYYVINWTEPAQPTYTATGVTGNAEYDSSGYTPLASSTKSDVKVYGSDSIVVANWCGADGYGICVALDSEGHVSELRRVKDGVSSTSGSNTSYMYAYTGLADYVDFGAYIPSYGNYYYITAYPGTTDDQSGYIEMWGYAYTSAKASSYQYYYIGWGSYAAASTEGIKTVSAPDTDADAPMYNLAGQRVGENAKGIVIKNGKKMVIK